MAERKSKDRTAALVGGAALIALLFSRGKGLGFRSPGDGRKTSGPVKRLTVWIRADRIELDGRPTDLSIVVEKAREAGEVEVHATGDAITRVVREVLTALHVANVIIYAPPDLAYIVPAEVLR
jgi:hypothetical protein